MSTDNPTQDWENTMARAAALDNPKLSIAINNQQDREDNREILTKAQQRLQYDEARIIELQEDSKVEDGEIAATEANIAKLQALLAKKKANRADMAIELQSALESAHKLKQMGISLPVPS